MCWGGGVVGHDGGHCGGYHGEHDMLIGELGGGGEDKVRGDREVGRVVVCKGRKRDRFYEKDLMGEL